MKPFSLITSLIILSSLKLLGQNVTTIKFHFDSIKYSGTLPFRDAIRSSNKVMNLAVHGHDEFQEFLQNIGKFKGDLIYLYLQDIDTRQIPNEILLLSKLEYLELIYNETLDPDSLFSQLKKLPSLQALTITERRDVGNHSVLKNIKLGEELKYLNLEANDLQMNRIPFSEFRFLKSLNVGSANLQLVPGEIWQLPNLEELTLAYNEGLNLNASLKTHRHSRIRRLDVSNCHIKTFPHQFLNENNFERIDLTSNKIRKIDGKKIKKDNELQTIDLTKNPIVSIKPDELRQFPKLKYFTIWQSKISQQNKDELKNNFPEVQFIF